jgi:protein TonB
MAVRKSLAFGASLLLHLGILYGLGAAFLAPAGENHTIQIDLESWSPLAPAAEPGFSQPQASAKPAAPAMSGQPAVERKAQLPTAAKPAPTHRASKASDHSRPAPTRRSPKASDRSRPAAHRSSKASDRPRPLPALAQPAPQSAPTPLTSASAKKSRPQPAGNASSPHTAVSPGPSPHTAGGTGPSRLQSYYAAVLARIEAAKQYPLSAQRRQIQGDVVVTFQLSPNGRLIDARLTTSSGFHSLDRAALEAVRRAAPYPKLPNDAGVVPNALTVTISFVLYR